MRRNEAAPLETLNVCDGANVIGKYLTLMFKYLAFNVQSVFCLVPTRGGLPGVREEGGVVLDLVGEDGGAVVAARLPHHARVLAVALNPQQVRRVRHIL